MRSIVNFEGRHGLHLHTKTEVLYNNQALRFLLEQEILINELINVDSKY